MKNNSQYLIPGAIVIAGAFIAGAMIFNGSNGGYIAANSGTDRTNEGTQQEQPSGSTDDVRPVDDSDHIKGDPDAPVKIVEYSDFECPFCQRFHNTMNQIMDKYGESGEVAWVYRHFPIEQLHSKAPEVALASECVASIGGNDAFWQFTDRYFEVSPSNNQTDIETVIPQLVEETGIDQAAFQECLDSRELTGLVEEDFNNAVASGGRGTPWSILIGPNGDTFPINGAQPMSAVEQLIDIARGES